MKKPCGHILMYVRYFESALSGEISGNFTWVQSFTFTHTIAFQSALYDNSNTLADAVPLKVK